MDAEVLTEDEAASMLVAHVFSGAIGPPRDKAVAYALVEATPTAFVWSAALEDLDGPAVPVDRFRIRIDRRTREISSPQPMVLTRQELAHAILSATGQHLASAARLTGGALSVSYQVTVHEAPDVAYVVQLRHHGRVASMDALMTFLSRTVDHHVLPIPLVFPIPGEKERQEATSMGRQITLLVDGEIASTTYPSMSHVERLTFVRKMALAFQACWRLPLPEPRLIGELVASTTTDGDVIFEVDPDRHHGLGGPFSSVRDYLRAYIRSSLANLEKQQGIDDYKERYLDRIRNLLLGGGGMGGGCGPLPCLYTPQTPGEGGLNSSA
ncbi:hypothetical protein VTK73DRAFT_699 [Phialemonium thermophilum]|uniref:Uncharacterized protein n=1 Tax=Phialemonium thermophilum TaxID=223376 RepID=A0ABR3VUE7_9PEZI